MYAILKHLATANNIHTMAAKTLVITGLTNYAHFDPFSIFFFDPESIALRASFFIVLLGIVVNIITILYPKKDT